MGYPMGHPIPMVPWDGIGMGPMGGGVPSHTNGMGLRTDVLHDIPYHLHGICDGIWQSNPIPYHGMGPNPYIP